MTGASSIPKDLAEIPRWLCWKLERNKDGLPTKVPYAAATGRRASSTDPATWTTHAGACDACGRIGADGIGFVFCDDDNIIGIDLDHVIDASGEVKPWALDVIARLNSFTETSPSGTGFHIYIRGKKPSKNCKYVLDPVTREAFEIYARDRFFTVTGAHVAGTPTTVRTVADDVLAAIVAEMEAKVPQKAKPPPPNGAQRGAASANLADDELLRVMFAAKNGAAIVGLYRGHHNYGSASEADLALCRHLAFWTGRDGAQMDRLFRGSLLMRDKWDTRRGESTYGALTIETACAGCNDTYTPAVNRSSANNYSANGRGAAGAGTGSAAGSAATNGAAPPTLRLTRADKVKVKRVEWLAAGRVPRGGMTLFDGPGGVGKTTFNLGVIAKATRGIDFFTGAAMEPQSALIVAVEDDRSLLTARLRLYDADLTRIYFVDAAHIGGTDVPLTLPDHVGILEQKIIEHAVAIVYIDALFSHLAIDGEGRMAHQVRACLAPIGDMCNRTCVAFLGIRHWGKATGSAISRALGSVELGNYARSVFAVGPHPNNDKLVACTHSKVNAAKLASAVAFEIVEHDVVDDDGKPWKVSIADKVGPAEGVTSDDLTMKAPSDPDDRASAAEWLRDYLADGKPHLTADVLKAAVKARAGDRTTLWRAATTIDVLKDRTTTYPSVGTWTLPQAGGGPAPDATASRAHAHDTRGATTVTTEREREKKALLHNGLDSCCTVVAEREECNDCETTVTGGVKPSKASGREGGTASERKRAARSPVVAQDIYSNDCAQLPLGGAPKTLIPQGSDSRCTAATDVAQKSDATTGDTPRDPPAPPKGSDRLQDASDGPDGDAAQEIFL